MNSNCLRLLSLCAENNLTITNAIFRMKMRCKISWMHPRSKHWHLLDYVIVRITDISSVYKTAAIRSAECSTDHRLIASDISWQIRPRARRTGTSSRKLKWASLHCPEIRTEFQIRVGEALRSDCDQWSEWPKIADTIRITAEQTI